jgi:hypothetical protein
MAGQHRQASLIIDMHHAGLASADGQISERPATAFAETGKRFRNCQLQSKISSG